LKLVAETQGDRQQVYPVWAQQQARLNADLLAVIPTVVAQLFEQNAEQRTSIAADLVNFGNLIQHFPLGTHWLNLELGIATYEQALFVYTRELFPEQWATTQNNLASAYSDRIRGERADNLERAIETYGAALQIRTRESFPEQWAMTQNNLAIAYSDRIRGERADNLERAIEDYEATLQVYTRESFPEDWAMTQNNLASTYSDRIRGERADNLERAIEAYEAVLQIRTRESFPEQWAGMQNNLAVAYRICQIDCVKGKRSQWKAIVVGNCKPI